MSRALTVYELSKLLDGKFTGNGDVKISGVNEPEKAKEGDIIAVYDKKLIPVLDECSYSAIIAKNHINDIKKPQIIVPNPKLSLAVLLDLFNPLEKPELKISKESKIEDNVIINGEIYIGDFTIIQHGTIIDDKTLIFPGCFIGTNVKIGKNCVIKPNVVIERDTIIGDNVIIHSGTVIGSDGYGYVQVDNMHKKVPQIGRVNIRNNVEIGANCAIDRAMLGETFIDEGSKIDNLVHIAHNVRIGKNCIIVAQVGIAGSSIIGDNCIFGGQVGIADHININDNCVIAAQSGVGKDVKKDGTYLFGSPAKDFKKMTKIILAMDKLPDLLKRVAKIEEQIKNQD